MRRAFLCIATDLVSFQWKCQTRSEKKANALITFFKNFRKVALCLNLIICLKFEILLNKVFNSLQLYFQLCSVFNPMYPHMTSFSIQFASRHLCYKLWCAEVNTTNEISLEISKLRDFLQDVHVARFLLSNKSYCFFIG